MLSFPGKRCCAGSFLSVVFLVTTLQAEPEYIYAFHDPGGESLMGSNKGWIVWTEAIGSNPNDFSGKDYTPWANQGYGVIVRLNNGYGSAGTIPPEAEYDNFAQRCANFVNNSAGADYFIIGNETNLPREWPGNNNGDPTTGEPITVSRYVSCYNKCWNQIKAVAPGTRLMPQPVGVWAPPYPDQGIEEFDEYWVNCLVGIGASRIDALALHAYTHGCDPALVTSEAMMGPPYTDIHFHFRVYQDLMIRIPSSMNDRPCFITECDQNIECADGASPRHAWNNSNDGWVREIYKEINNWNLNNSQKIRCVALFRWPMVTEGEYTFGIEDRDQIHADFQQAVSFGYKWNVGPGSGGSGCGTGPGTPTGANLAIGARFYIESGRNQTDQYGRFALDGATTTKWTANVDDSGGSGSLVLDLGSDASVTGFVVHHAESGGEADYLNTELFRVESGSSMHGPWTIEWDADNSCQEAFNTFQYSSAKTLRYVRLVVTDPGIDSWIRLPEFEVYGAAGSAAAFTIEAEDYAGGVNAAGGVDYSDSTSGNTGGAYRGQDVDIESSTDGRFNVGWTEAGEWLDYPIQGDGSTYAVTMRFATPTGDGSCRFELDGVDVTGTLTFTSTGGWQTWDTLQVGDITIGTGWHSVRFVVESPGFNIASITFDPNGGSSMTADPPAGTNLALSATQVSVSSQFDASNGGDQAIDGVIDAGSKWTSDGSAMPEWLVLDLGADRTVNGFVVYHAEAGGEPDYYNTEQFKIQSGTSFTGPWVDEAVVDNSAQESVTNRSYVTPKTLRYVRLYITDAGIDNYVRLPEFEVRGSDGGGGATTVAEDFDSMPSWSSEFDASWGSVASWSINAGGEAGNGLEVSRASEGSSAKVKVYSINTSTDYTLSIWVKCPSHGSAYWVETAFRPGNHSASDFDSNAGSWTMVKKFSDTGTNGNGNTWTQYSVGFNSGSESQVSVGFKLGSAGGGGPTVLWDTLRIK